MSRVNAIFHIVINTKNRKMTINNEHREDLYRYIWKILKNKGCVLYRINGIANHIHMLIDLKKDLSLSDLMKELKQSSSIWAKQCGLFPEFEGWGKEYAAFSCSYSHKDAVIEYIKSQQEHHNVKSFEEEIRQIYNKAGVDWNDLYLT